MYVTAYIEVSHEDGTDHEYEVGAEVSEDGELEEEPEVSAPDCPLKSSRVIPAYMPSGWETEATDRLLQAWDDKLRDLADDEYDDDHGPWSHEEYDPGWGRELDF